MIPGGGVPPGGGERRLARALRVLVLGLLLGVVACETYYIVSLRKRVSARSDELKSLSMQLQSLRNERAELHEELSSIKYSNGEDTDGNPSVR